MPQKMQISPALTAVRVADPFWSAVQHLMTETVLPYQAAVLEDKIPGTEPSGAIRNFQIAAGEAEGAFSGMVFQDSDVAKWLEAAAYSLSFCADGQLAAKLDETIALIGRAQDKDGYLNTYFTIKEPERRWQNLLECHELYCAGHLIEAAAAHFAVTGRDNLLQIAIRLADHICARFGRGEGQVRGVPGHQEIEEALLRLYRCTGEKRYLATARYFLDERGTEPEYFAEEAARRDWTHWGMKSTDRRYAQYHAPVRAQCTAEGHAVRAVYMYTAMADLAAEIGDEALAAACRRLWDNICEKRMYVTGGIGQSRFGEAFTVDNELPNDLIYAETCASVGMVFFARRMLEMYPAAQYADIMEKELYNGVLSGLQLDGKRFFYVNPLEVVPEVSGVLEEYKHVLPKRPGWYSCACCPPNVARLLTSLGQYIWGESSGGAEATIYAHLYIGSEASFFGGKVKFKATSAMPWQGSLTYTVEAAERDAFTFAVRKAEYIKEWQLQLNGRPLTEEDGDCRLFEKDGYLYIRRCWQRGDRLEIHFTLRAQRLWCNPRVRHNIAQTALRRGPLIYAFEEADNGPNLAALRLPREAALELSFQPDLLGGVAVIEAEGRRRETEGKLYSDTPPRETVQKLRAVPYYCWGNRGAGGMRVWLSE